MCKKILNFRLLLLPLLVVCFGVFKLNAQNKALQSTPQTPNVYKTFFELNSEAKNIISPAHNSVTPKAEANKVLQKYIEKHPNLKLNKQGTELLKQPPPQPTAGGVIGQISENKSVDAYKIKPVLPTPQLLADTLLFEDFQTGQLGTDWISLDVDELNVASNFVENVLYSDSTAWEVTGNGLTGNGIAVASCSFHNPPGNANDWLITPPVTIGNSGAYIIEWIAAARYSVADGYQIRVTTNAGAPINKQNITTLFSDIVFSVNAEQFGTFKRRYLNLDAYAGQTIRLAFVNNSNQKRMVYIDDIFIGRKNDNDVAATSIRLPSANCQLTANSPVEVQVYNNGGLTQTNIPVKVDVNNGMATTTYSSTVSTLNPLEMATLTIDVDLSVPGTYTAVAYTTLVNEEMPANDSTTKVQTTHLNPVNIMSEPFRFGFEPTDNFNGWFIRDVNTDGFTWRIINNPNFSHQGSAMVAYGADGSVNSNANDWLFSPCVDLVAGQTYALDFFYRRVNSTDVKTVEVYFGSAQDPTAMVNPIVSLNNVTNDTYQEENATFTPTASGTYYLGFKATSPAGQGWILMDNITLGPKVNTDVAVLDITVPDSDCGLSAPVTIDAKVRNPGLQNLTGVPFQLIIDDTVKHSQLVDLTAGQTKNITFSNVDLSVQGRTYAIKAVANLTTDLYKGNDTSATQAVYHLADFVIDNKVYFNDFETSDDLIGWDYYDENSDNITWRQVTNPNDAFSGESFLIYGSFNGQNGPSANANDWLVSPCLYFEADSLYELSFYCRTLFSNTPHNFRVWLGTGNTPALLNTTVFEQMGFAGNYKKFTARFKVSASGIYHLGWQDFSLGGQHTVLFLEDVQIKKVEPIDVAIANISTPEVGCALSANENVVLTVLNKGTKNLPAFDAQLFIDNAMVGSTTVLAGLKPDSVKNITFSGLDFSGPNAEYFVKGKVVLPADTNNVNDTTGIVRVKNMMPHSVDQSEYFMGFDSINLPGRLDGWKIIDANNDKVDWGYVVNGFSGQAKFDTDDWVTADDWLISPCLGLSQGQFYEVYFGYYVGILDVQNIDCYLLNAQDPLAIDTLLYSKTNASNWIQDQVVKENYYCHTTGSYYLGFHIKNAQPGGSVYLDNILVRKKPPYNVALGRLVTPSIEDNICPSPNHNLRIQVNNVGSANLVNVPIKAKIITPAGSQMLIVDTLKQLNVLADTVFTFTNTFDASVPGNYSVSVWSDLDSDIDKTNDTASFMLLGAIRFTEFMFTVRPDVTAPLIEDFNGSDPNQWATSTYGRNGSLTDSVHAFSLYSNFFTLVNVRQSFVSPVIKGVSADHWLTFDYRFAEYMLTEPGDPYNPVPGDSLLVEVSANCGPFQPLIAIDYQNNDASVDFAQSRVSLAAFAGQEIRIRFVGIHNGSAGFFNIEIDNIEVRDLPDYDLEVKTVTEENWENANLTLMPARQAVSGFGFSTEIFNNGKLPINNATLNLSVMPGGFTDQRTNISLQPAEKKKVSYFNFMVPSVAATYHATVAATIAQPEPVLSNNTVQKSFRCDTTFARDRNDAQNGLFFAPSSNPNGKLATTYTLYNDDTLTSISFFVHELTAPAVVRAFVTVTNNTDGAPILSALKETANINLNPSHSFSWITVPLNRPLAGSSQGRKYAFGIRQISGEAQIGYNTEYGENNAAFGSTGGNYFSFENSTIGKATLFIRPNFGLVPVITGLKNDVPAAKASFKVFPNPAYGSVTVQFSPNAQQATGNTLKFMDVSGKVIKQIRLNPGQNILNINVADMPKGLYLLQVVGSGTLNVQKLIIR